MPTRTRPRLRPIGRSLATAAGVEPVTLDELKNHLRIDGSDEDDLLNRLITVSRRSVERESWRALITQTWDVVFASFPSAHGVMVLPLPPLQSVDSVKYDDADGNEQTLASSVYQVDATSEPARIALARGQVWPTTEMDALAPVTVRITAGFGDAASDVPENYQQAILLTAATLYENRENVVTGTIVTRIPGTARALIDLDHAKELV